MNLVPIETPLAKHVGLSLLMEARRLFLCRFSLNRGPAAVRRPAAQEQASDKGQPP